MTKGKGLTDASIRKFAPGTKRRRIRDHGAQSLFLVIEPSGVKAFEMRFRRPSGKIGKMRLGRMAAALRAYPFLPKRRGGIAQTPEQRADRAAAEAAIYQQARRDRERLIAAGTTSRADATEQKVKDLKKLLPHLAETTIGSRLLRRR
jgi:hypothetical protein